MKKLISCICVFILLLALAVPACAEDFEQNPRVEQDGDTIRLTCGPELSIKEDENHAYRQVFHLFKHLARWEYGPATLELNCVNVETFTIKKMMSIISWDWLSGIFEGDTFTAIELRWIVTCPEGVAVWLDPSAAVLCLPGGEPVPTFRYLSGQAELKKVDEENKFFFQTTFAIKEIDAHDVDMFDYMLPAVFGADLDPLCDPLRLHVELLHEP